MIALRYLLLRAALRIGWAFHFGGRPVEIAGLGKVRVGIWRWRNLREIFELRATGGIEGLAQIARLSVRRSDRAIVDAMTFEDLCEIFNAAYALNLGPAWTSAWAELGGLADEVFGRPQ